MIELVVVQSTPFCNLDCSYCYLPDRRNKRTMPPGTLTRLVDRLLEAAPRLSPDLSIVWHAGEPLTAPVSFYERAVAEFRRLEGPGRSVRHCFQTNGVLIDRRWCDFFSATGASVGVSIDGPQPVHDAHRVTRNGKGTHDAAVAGARRLAEHGIPYHAIAVLSEASMGQVDAIYDFFKSDLPGLHSVGFNVEELEGVHRHSTLFAARVEDRFREFWEGLMAHLEADPEPLVVREVEQVRKTLLDRRYGQHKGNSQNVSGEIINVSVDGEVGTFSPELLGITHPIFGKFSFGQLETRTIDDILSSGLAQRLAAEIDRGVRQCEEECRFFAFCRGGAPANKYAETGRFDSTETAFCRLTQKIVVEVTLQYLERINLKRLKKMPLLRWIASGLPHAPSAAR